MRNLLLAVFLLHCLSCPGEVSHSCVANCETTPPPAAAGGQPVDNGMVNAVGSGIVQGVQIWQQKEAENKRTAEQAFQLEVAMGPQIHAGLGNEMMLGEPKELTGLGDVNRRTAQSGPLTAGRVKCALGAVGDGTQFTCHALTCGGSSGNSVCCPNGYPFLNQCDCQCYRTNQINCHTYSACQHDERVQ